MGEAGQWTCRAFIRSFMKFATAAWPLARAISAAVWSFCKGGQTSDRTTSRLSGVEETAIAARGATYLIVRDVKVGSVLDEDSHGAELTAHRCNVKGRITPLQTHGSTQYSSTIRRTTVLNDKSVRRGLDLRSAIWRRSELGSGAEGESRSRGRS